MQEPSAGDLNRRIRFERKSRTRDEIGGQAEAWASLITVAAQISPLRGGEEVQANRLSGIQRFTITVRSDSTTRTLTPDDRAVDARSGQKLNLKWSANWDERDRFITLIADAGGPADE